MDWRPFMSFFYLHVTLCLMDMRSGSSCLAILIINTYSKHRSTYNIAQHCQVNLTAATAGKASKLAFDRVWVFSHFLLICMVWSKSSLFIFFFFWGVQHGRSHNPQIPPDMLKTFTPISSYQMRSTKIHNKWFEMWNSPTPKFCIFFHVPPKTNL